MLRDRAETEFSRVKSIGTLAQRNVLKGKVGSGNLGNDYQFSLKHRSRVNLSLSNLKANADLALLKPNGKVLQRSGRGGRKSETIQRTLAPGNYSIRVHSRSGLKETGYQLTAAGRRTRGFDIKFDYRFDQSGWFNRRRKAALRAAGRIWERIIRDDFDSVPAGTETPFVANPQTGGLIDTFVTDQNIDDLLIFVGARDIGASSTLAFGQSSGYFLDESRYVGSDFEPWIGSVAFNSSINWFFDRTPGTRNDVPSNKYDLISVAAHEIGHVLGFSNGSRGINAFIDRTDGDTFDGPQARRRNGDNPIPLEFTGSSHVEPGYQFRRSGEALMSPVFSQGERRLPTVLDLAILDDIGYQVRYKKASRNPRSRQLSLGRSLATNGQSSRCGCASCLMS